MRDAAGGAEGKALAADRANASDKGGVAGFFQEAGRDLGAAKNLPLNVERLTLQTNPVTAGSEILAEKALGRITGSGSKKADQYDKLAAKLVQLLPDGALYPSVISQIDQRQVLSHVMAGSTNKSTTVGGVTFSPAERVLAGQQFQVEQARSTTAAGALATQANVTGDAAIKAYVEQTAGAFRGEGTALAPSPLAIATASTPTAPGAAPTAAAAAVAGSAGGGFASVLANLTSGATSTKPFLTDGDVQALFRLSSSDLGAVNTYLNQLIDYRTNVNPKFRDPFKVQSGVDATGRDPFAPITPALPDDQVPQNVLIQRQMTNQQDQAKGSQGYSITQAKDLLYTMSKDEVAKMQTLLMRAGYFANSQGKSTAPLYSGDPTDPLTQQAWTQLVGDSIRGGKPIFDTLTGKAAAAGTKFATIDGKPAQDIALTDSAQIAQGADQLGQKEIGRKLTDAEHAQVVDFIHSLETKAQTTTNEPGSQTVEQPDVQAEITKFLDTQFPTEKAGTDVADTYDLFTKMLAGPAGGAR